MSGSTRAARVSGVRIEQSGGKVYWTKVHSTRGVFSRSLLRSPHDAFPRRRSRGGRGDLVRGDRRFDTGQRRNDGDGSRGDDDPAGLQD